VSHGVRGMSDPDQATDLISLPDSLLTVESLDTAVEIYFATGLKNVLLHAPTPSGGCTCGKAHDTSKSGSSSIGKHPIQKGWQKSSPSLDELKDQIARCKFVPNIGIVLGKQPDGEYLIAVDVDDEARMAELEAEYGPLPSTPRCDSGRGYRLFFSAPPEIDVSRLSNVTALGSTKEDPKPGVDVKVESGQVVVAPSLHANGKRYVWTVVGPIAQLPVHWAMQLLKKLETPKFIEKYTPSQMNKPGGARNRAERYLAVAVGNEARALSACGHGNRNNTLYSTACRMFEYCGGMHLSHKWQWVHDELLAAARACGLPETESRKTLASAEKRVRESGKVKAPMVLASPAREPESRATEPVDQPESLPPWLDAPKEDPRPVIKVSPELHLNVEEAISALRNDDNLYQREKRLVYITRVTPDQSEASPIIETDDGRLHRQLVEGSPQICEMEMPTVRERLSKIAIFKKWVEKKQDYTQILPTDEIVSAVHKRKQWDGIRSLVGITETPTLRPDGTIMQTPGYDPMTRYLYMPNDDFPEIPDSRATQEKARECLDYLNEIFIDFPYVNQAHRSVPVAAILTLVARPAILGSIPAILFDASTRGSGKTLQTDAIAVTATGRGAPRMNYSTDEVELEKILAGYALKGSTFICLDNVPAMRPFGGGPMDRVITARDEVDLRVLGKSQVLTLPWRALVMATGNNISLYGDTSRRVLMARLEPQEESPEHRTQFKYPDLLAWVQSQRRILIACALCILRAYFVAGRPNMGCARWGSFEEWSRLIPNAIKFAGGSDPMLARPESEEEVDNELRNIRSFIVWMRDNMGDEEFRLSSVIDLLYRCERKRVPETGEFAPDGQEDLRDAIASLVGRKGMKFDGRFTAPDPVELGRRLAAFKGRIINGLRLASKIGHGGIMRWRVEKIGSPSGTNLSGADP
jgi:hypothetical protein